MSSPRSSSTLFAARMTGFFFFRSIFTTISSVAVGPVVASTTRTTASAMSTATSDWIAIREAMPFESESQPPVSTRVKSLPFHSAR